MHLRSGNRAVLQLSCCQKVGAAWDRGEGGRGNSVWACVRGGQREPDGWEGKREEGRKGMRRMREIKRKTQKRRGPGMSRI